MRPTVDAVLAPRAADFETGVVALSRLCAGKTYVCVAPGSRIAVPVAERSSSRNSPARIPRAPRACTSSSSIPSVSARTAWHIGYQDVAAIGRLLATGQLDVERVITLAGPWRGPPAVLAHARRRLAVDAYPRANCETDASA